MSETYPSDDDCNALDDTTLGGGLPVPDDDEADFKAAGNRFLWWLDQVLRPLAGIRLYQDSTDSATQCSVSAGSYLKAGARTAYAGAVNQALTDNQTNYVYLTAAGVLTINVTGFPAAPHVPIATVAVAGGTYDINGDVTNCRAPAVTTATSAHRPAVKALAAVYFSGRPGDDELLTINGRTYETDDDGDWPQAAGDVQCDLQGNATVDDDITDIAAAINGDGSASVTAVADTANDVLWLYAAEAGSAGNAITLVTALTNTTVSGATLADGADAAMVAVVPISHTITAAEAANGLLRVDTGLTSIECLQVLIEQGNQFNDDVTAAVSGGVVTLGDAAAQWDAGDILRVLVVGTL